MLEILPNFDLYYTHTSTIVLNHTKGDIERMTVDHVIALIAYTVSQN